MSPIDPAILADARILWDYHRLGMPYGAADVVLGLGSYDPAVAEHAADLFLAGRGKRLMFTGHASRQGNLLRTPWDRPEAEVFRDIAVARRVSPGDVIVETQATNTGENLRFSLAELARLDAPRDSLIIVTKPNMERRVRATAAKCIPHVAFSVTSPSASFEDYCIARFDPAFIINLMVGDLQRIELYPGLGFQAAEDVPAPVRASYDRLVAAGFTEHLVAA